MDSCAKFINSEILCRQLVNSQYCALLLLPAAASSRVQRVPQRDPCTLEKHVFYH
jgi:hypothetical protein